MSKVYILDTNVLLHDPESILAFEGEKVILSIEVIEKVDRFKRDLAELGKSARRVSRIIGLLRQRGPLGQEIILDHGGSIQILMERPQLDCTENFAININLGENKILGYGLALQRTEQYDSVIVVTKDINLRLKADTLGLQAENYEKDRFDEALSYDGYHKISVDPDDIEEFHEIGSLNYEGLNTLRKNEFVTLENSESKKIEALARVASHNNRVLVPLKHNKSDLLGITPLNIEQTFVMEALLDDKIKLVTLVGKAGTGKTLLAVAAGLKQVLRDFTYNKVLVARPVIPMGRDIGYLPGTIEEKMKPWMQPIYDSVEFIRSMDRRSRKPSLPPNLMEMEELQIEPLTYIRGRSIPHQFMIIDEAQNLTPLEAKTIISRVGKNTKIILTGDPEQMDSPYLDEFSNGLSYVVGRLRDSHLSAHIHLQKGERSELAEQAATLL